MVRRWERFRNPWDREYAMRGALWRGVDDASWVRAWVPPGARVVDLGCGDGKFLAGLVASGYDAVGLDFAPNALRLVRKRLAAPLVLARAQALPVATASLRGVAARYLLGALAAQERRAAAGEIERVTAPGGVLVAEEFSRRDFRHGSGREVEPDTFERNRGLSTHYFERDELPLLFPGFRLEEVTEVESRQRLPTGAAVRHRWRWVLRRHGEAPKRSNGAAAPARS